MSCEAPPMLVYMKIAGCLEENDSTQLHLVCAVLYWPLNTDSHAVFFIQLFGSALTASIRKSSFTENK